MQNMPPTRHERGLYVPAPDPTDIYVGRDFGRHDYVVTPELVAAYMRRGRRPQPDLHRRRRSAAPVAPALLLHSEVYAYRDHPKAAAVVVSAEPLRQPARAPGVGAVPAGDGRRRRPHALVHRRPLRQARPRLRRERSRCSSTPTTRVVARQRTHQSFLRETKNEGVVIDKTREKSVRARRSRSTRRRRSRTIPPVRKEITLDMCWKFSGPNKNYHNDKEIGDQAGASRTSSCRG